MTLNWISSALLNIQIHIKLTGKRYLYIALNMDINSTKLRQIVNFITKCKKFIQNNKILTGIAEIEVYFVDKPRKLSWTYWITIAIITKCIFKTSSNIYVEAFLRK